MDTKLKKSSNASSARKGLCIASSLLFIISSTVAFFKGMHLAIAYTYCYGYDVIEEIQRDISNLWVYEAPAILIACVSLAVAIITCGSRDDEGRIKLNWFDKIFNEIQIIAAICIGCCFIGSGYMFADYILKTGQAAKWVSLASGIAPFKESGGKTIEDIVYSWIIVPSNFEPRWVEFAFAMVLTAATSALLLLILLSIVKKIKGKCFWKNTIIGKLCCYVNDKASGSDNVFWKVMLTLILACLVSATWIGTVVVLILILIFVPKWLSKYQAVKDGVEEVKSGNLEYKIQVEENDNGEFDKLAKSINEISSATNIAVQNELKNQRMKTDLISNVSHDLKTPLTSMVSYVDLLKREGLTSENAPQYLDILDEKTKRLQKLTEDLFEAAKASSGAIPVTIEKIEMTAIVNQALGELEEKLSENDLKVYFNPPEEVNFVMADGQLLWRVIENLLVNVSKYALPGSRVYLDITEQGNNLIMLDVKNISKEPLNISTDELMERFKRGDDARNTEGSGLGLAIAKDLTKLMNGWFEITIDGDLFKASVALTKAE